jgi:hypothetical protein
MSYGWKAFWVQVPEHSILNLILRVSYIPLSFLANGLRDFTLALT